MTQSVLRSRLVGKKLVSHPIQPCRSLQPDNAPAQDPPIQSRLPQVPSRLALRCLSRLAHPPLLPFAVLMARNGRRPKKNRSRPLETATRILGALGSWDRSHVKPCLGSQHTATKALQGASLRVMSWSTEPAGGKRRSM